jgi:hypothetical protein
MHASEESQLRTVDERSGPMVGWKLALEVALLILVVLAVALISFFTH